MKIIKGALVALALNMQASAFAQDKPHVLFASMTGNEFLAKCNSPAKNPEATAFNGGACLGYVIGISDGLAMTQIKIPDGFDPICIPPAASLEQKRDVVIEYIKRNPAIRHEQIGLLTIKAWRNAWHCYK